MFEGKMFIIESIYIAIKLKLLAMMVLNITLMFKNFLTKSLKPSTAAIQIQIIFEFQIQQRTYLSLRDKINFLTSHK